MLSLFRYGFHIVLTSHRIVLEILCVLLFNYSIVLPKLYVLNMYWVQIFLIFNATDFISILKFQSLFNHSLIVKYFGLFPLMCYYKVAIDIFVQIGLKAIFFRYFSKVGIVSQKSCQFIYLLQCQSALYK